MIKILKKVKVLVMATALVVLFGTAAPDQAHASVTMDGPRVGELLVTGQWDQILPYFHNQLMQNQHPTSEQWKEWRNQAAIGMLGQILLPQKDGGANGTAVGANDGAPIVITTNGTGVVETPNQKNLGVWITIKPGMDRSNGAFRILPVADPPFPLDGKPVIGKLVVQALAPGWQIQKMVIDGQEVKPDQEVTIEKVASFGTHIGQHYFAVSAISQSGQTASLLGQINMKVEQFSAAGTNGSGSGTYSKETNYTVENVEKWQDAYIKNYDSKWVDVNAEVVGTITDKNSEYITIKDETGKSIRVKVSQLPSSIDKGSKVRVSGKVKKDSNGLIIEASEVADPASEKRRPMNLDMVAKPAEKKIDINLDEFMKQGEAEAAKIRGQQDAVAPTPPGGGNNTPHPPSGGPTPQPQSKEEFVQNAAKNQVGFLKSILNYVFGTGDKPNTISEMNDEAPGMISARSSLSVMASVAGIAVGGCLIFGIGALSAPVLIGAAVIGLGICAVTGGFSDIGDFLNNTGYISYLIKEHPGSVAADVALGAVTSMLPGIGSVAGRLLSGSKTAALATVGDWLTAKMPATAGPIGDIFHRWKAESQVAKSISEKIAFTGRNNEGLRESIQRTAENMRNSEQLLAKLSNANPKISAQEIGKIKKYSDRILKSDAEIIHKVENELKEVSNLSQTKNSKGFYEVNKVKLNENFESTERFSGNAQQIKNHVEEVNENMAIRNTNNALKDVKIDQARISKLFTGINAQGSEVIDQKIK